MNFNRRLAGTMAGAVAIVGSVAAVGLPATSARAATTSVALPISQYSHMVVDPVHHHLFISSGGGSSSILVTDYSGQTVATIANEPGATGLALSGDGKTVYAALANGDAISAISTATLAETARYATGTGTDPAYVAYTSGKIWFGYGAAAQGGIGSINPGTSPATVTLNATNDPALTWYSAPMLTASRNGNLVAGGGGSPIELASYNVSSGTATVLTAPTYISQPTYATTASGLGSLQVTPDGKDVVVASSAPYYQQIFQVSDLAAIGQYPTTYYPDAVSIASNGTVAAGTGAYSNQIYLFAPGGSTPLNTYTFYGKPVPDGVALTPDGSELFAITSPSTAILPGQSPTLDIVTDPAQGPSTLSLSAPGTATGEQAITLTGTLGGTSPYAGGQTLNVTRIDPAHPSGVTLRHVTTNADGSFSFTTTTPEFEGASETVTYQVSYAGDAYLTASTASASVTVSGDD